MRPGLVSCVAGALCAVLVTAGAEAESESARWEPGERTTSRVDGEISASEKPARTDGAYGRLDSDLDLGFGLGAEVSDDAPRGALRMSLHYFSTFGITLSYADALGASNAEHQRVASFGVDLKPAFLPRWASDMEQGPATLDLLLDSISLGVGVFFAEPAGAELGDERGLELSGGLGLPLAAHAAGPWLEARGVFRWRDPGQPTGERADAAVLAVLSWHALMLSPLLD